MKDKQDEDERKQREEEEKKRKEEEGITSLVFMQTFIFLMRKVKPFWQAGV